jgi:hypothetical protein
VRSGLSAIGASLLVTLANRIRPWEMFGETFWETFV